MKFSNEHGEFILFGFLIALFLWMIYVIVIECCNVDIVTKAHSYKEYTTEESVLKNLDHTEVCIRGNLYLYNNHNANLVQEFEKKEFRIFSFHGISTIQTSVPIKCGVSSK